MQLLTTAHNNAVINRGVTGREGRLEGRAMQGGRVQLEEGLEEGPPSLGLYELIGLATLNGMIQKPDIFLSAMERVPAVEELAETEALGTEGRKKHKRAPLGMSGAVSDLLEQGNGVEQWWEQFLDSIMGTRSHGADETARAEHLGAEARQAEADLAPKLATLDPVTAAHAMLRQFDTNKDGVVLPANPRPEPCRHWCKLSFTVSASHRYYLVCLL